jgi:2',3'-cyclic-nucleotide 2'-phosphodiesterase (5'-nucleotidase family)
MALGMLDISLLSVEELEQRMDEANFAMLSANAYMSGTQDLLANPYVVITLADHRVGILGLTEAGATADVMVTDPIAAAKERLPELQGVADIVIVLSHAGLDTDRLIAEQIPGISLIVSGRGKTVEAAQVVQRTGTLLLHADTPRLAEAGQRIGVAHLSFDQQGRLFKQNWRKVVLTGEMEEDPELKAWLKAIPAP